MKKIIILLAVLVAVSIFAVAQKSKANFERTRALKAAENQGSDKNNDNQNKQGASETLETTSTETPELSETSEVAKTPERGKSDQSQGISAAVHELLDTAKELDDPGIGEQVRLIATVQNENQNRINQSVTKAQQRSGFAKFFIGANFKELKQARKLMEQNTVQTRELERLLSQVANEGQKTLLREQIEVLNQQNTILAEQINELAGGFSLFGWLNKLVNKY